MAAAEVVMDRGQVSSTRLFLLVVVSAVFTTTLTGSMVNVILPVIRAQFGGSPAQLGWIVTGYALGYAIGVPLYGRASDIFGVRRVFAIGLLGFAAGGLICALAPNLALLVAGRTIQGIGGAAVPALASVAVAKVLPPGSRGGALGLTASSVGVGSSVGPIVGGVGEQFFGWRALFVGSLTLMLLVIPFAWRVLPDGSSQDERSFDLLGGLLLGLGAGLFLFGITQGQSVGFASATSWGSFLGAIVAAVGFTWRINRAARPFVSPALFQNRGYVTAMTAGFFAMMANLSALVFAPLLVVEVNGLASGATGLVLTPSAIAVAIFAQLAGRLSDRVGVQLPIVGGLTIVTIALLYLSTFAGASPVLIAVGMVGMGIGSAFISSPLNNAAANALPERQIGGGMGLFTGAFFLGGGTGPAIFGAFLAARQEVAVEALNPLNAFSAAPYSDTFLVMALAPVIALIAASRLQRGTRSAKGRPEA